MTYTVLGKGPGAVRISSRPDGVELRLATTVITGNHDMRRALAWVLRHAPAENGSDASLGELGTTLAEVCSLLVALAEEDVPLETWGAAWAARCAPDRPEAPA